MSKPFDATRKHLLEKYPYDWLRLLGFRGSPNCTMIDADLSTVTAAADKVLRVDDAVPWLLHLELQASYDAALPQRLLLDVAGWNELLAGS